MAVVCSNSIQEMDMAIWLRSKDTKVEQKAFAYLIKKKEKAT